MEKIIKILLDTLGLGVNSLITSPTKRVNDLKTLFKNSEVRCAETTYYVTNPEYEFAITYVLDGSRVTSYSIHFHD